MPDTLEGLEALIGQLLAVYREPLRYQKQLKGPLPEPFHQVLRLAVGKTLPRIDFFCQRWQTSPEELRKAAIFFIEQACLSGRQNPYRILGLNPGAAPHTIQAHYHLLMLLFHPDRSEAAATWRDGYAAQLNEAYQRLRKRGKRPAYERNLTPQGPQKKSQPPIYNYQPFQKKRSFLTYLVQRFPKTIRYLPQLILGGGIAVTVALLVNLYFVQTTQEAVLVTFPLERKEPSKALTSSQGIAAEQGETLPGVAQRAALSVIGDSSQPAVKPAEETAIEQSQLLKTTVASGKQVIADDNLEPPRTPVREERELNIQESVINSLSAFVNPKINDGPASVVGNAAMEITPSAAPRESILAKKKPSAVLANHRTSTLSVPTPSLQQEALQKLLQHFTSAYRQGDLKDFLALFSLDARTNDYSGWSAIRQDYAQFFAATQARKLQLLDLRWLIDGNTANGKGRYIAWIRKPKGTYESRGQIHFQVQSRKGITLITGLFNTVDNQRNASTQN